MRTSLLQRGLGLALALTLVAAAPLTAVIACVLLVPRSRSAS